MSWPKTSVTGEFRRLGGGISTRPAFFAQGHGAARSKLIHELLHRRRKASAGWAISSVRGAVRRRRGFRRQITAKKPLLRSLCARRGSDDWRQIFNARKLVVPQSIAPRRPSQKLAHDAARRLLSIKSRAHGLPNCTLRIAFALRRRPLQSMCEDRRGLRWQRRWLGDTLVQACDEGCGKKRGQ